MIKKRMKKQTRRNYLILPRNIEKTMDHKVKLLKKFQEEEIKNLQKKKNLKLKK